jgi:hypothetical protein
MTHSHLEYSDFNYSNYYNPVFDIFTKSNIIFLFFFLMIYLLLFYIVSIFINNNTLLITTRFFDAIIILIVVLILVGNYFFSYNYGDQQNIFEKSFLSFQHYVSWKYSIFSTILFIIFLYIFVYFIGIPMTYSEKPLSISIIESTAWIILLITIIADFFLYFFGIDIIDIIEDMLENVWGNLPEKSWMPVFSGKINLSVSGNGNCTSTNISGNGNCRSTVITNTVYVKIDDNDSNTDASHNEVFNIANNLYTYSDAKQVCSIYGAKLATYKQMEEAYNKGAEWCNYGWSADQMALFPTQYSTWTKLQNNPYKKNACGRPGINGGYFDNPNLKFGVNCYGKKPKPSGLELNIMEKNQNHHHHHHPKTNEELLIEQKNIFWKENSDKMLNINSFNTNSWSVY